MPHTQQIREPKRPPPKCSQISDAPDTHAVLNYCLSRSRSCLHRWDMGRQATCSSRGWASAQRLHKNTHIHKCREQMGHMKWQCEECKRKRKRCKWQMANGKMQSVWRGRVKGKNGLSVCLVKDLSFILVIFSNIKSWKGRYVVACRFIEAPIMSLEQPFTPLELGER